MAAWPGGDEHRVSYRGAVGSGLATAITTFLPILIGLLTADGDVSTSIYGFGALAAIAAAAVATYKFVDNEEADVASYRRTRNHTFARAAQVGAGRHT